MITTDLPDRLDAQIPSLMQAENVPGLSLALVRQARIYWSGVFGLRNRATQEPVTEDTLFEAASLSKPVFAYAALKLCEAGILDLDTPLAGYQPDPYVPGEPRLKLVTMRHVLSHTTGFPNWRPEGGALTMRFTPGERFSYSGEGYMYLQAVVEHLTRQAPAAFMQSNLLGPLGMAHSRFVLDDLDAYPVAVGHDAKGEAQEKHLWREMIAAASLHCNARDFAGFLCAVMRPAAENPAHLSPAMARAMLAPQVQVNQAAAMYRDVPPTDFTTNELVGWGLGWGTQRTAAGETIWHWGDNGNYRAFVLGHPGAGEGIVILTNGRNGQKVIDRILRDIVGGDYPALDWLFG